ncbi:hypothetical protein B0H14DRAFT_1346871 [Mycena olivaceomarginata]|nr:hypothetical protein B0H14DRAFT_1346871 [Mycena olivaceomarginata]
MKRIKEKINNTLRRSAVREAITGDRLLPPELEQQIFQLVAANDPVGVWRHQHMGDTVLVLPQLCRRVQIWIDPFIYERISLLRSYNDARPVPNFLATIKTRPANFFAAHVKYCSISLNSWVTRHRPPNPRIFSGVSQVTETDHELAKEVTKNARKRRKIQFFLPRDALALDLPRRSHD